MSAETSKTWLNGRAAGIVDAAQEAKRILTEGGWGPQTTDALRIRLLELIDRAPAPANIQIEGPMTGPVTTAQPSLTISGRGHGSSGWAARDEFAARAMQTLLAQNVRPPAGGSAVQAYAIADEMIVARESTSGQAEAMRSKCLEAALAVFDQPGGFTRDDLKNAIAWAKP